MNKDDIESFLTKLQPIVSNIIKNLNIFIPELKDSLRIDLKNLDERNSFFKENYDEELPKEIKYLFLEFRHKLKEEILPYSNMLSWGNLFPGFIKMVFNFSQNQEEFFRLKRELGAKGVVINVLKKQYFDILINHFSNFLSESENLVDRFLDSNKERIQQHRDELEDALFECFKKEIYKELF